MGGTGQTKPYGEAMVLAEDIVQLLRPYCDRIEIGGSLRRKRPDVGDVEIVCVPKWEHRQLPSDDGLFAELAPTRQVLVNLLDEAVFNLLQPGDGQAVFVPRLDKNGHRSIGSLNKRLLYREFGLDVFSTTAAGWGVTMAIRTGPEELSRALVTMRKERGLCPNNLQVRVGDGACVCYRADGEVIPTPEEADVFKALELEWVEPKDRDLALPKILAAAAKS